MRGLYRLSWKERLTAESGEGNGPFKRRVCTIGVAPTPYDEFELGGPTSVYRAMYQAA